MRKPLYVIFFGLFCMLMGTDVPELFAAGAGPKPIPEVGKPRESGKGGGCHGGASAPANSPAAKPVVPSPPPYTPPPALKKGKYNQGDIPEWDRPIIVYDEFALEDWAKIRAALKDRNTDENPIFGIGGRKQTSVVRVDRVVKGRNNDSLTYEVTGQVAEKTLNESHSAYADLVDSVLGLDSYAPLTVRLNGFSQIQAKDFASTWYAKGKRRVGGSTTFLRLEDSVNGEKYTAENKLWKVTSVKEESGNIRVELTADRELVLKETYTLNVELMTDTPLPGSNAKKAKNRIITAIYKFLSGFFSLKFKSISDICACDLQQVADAEILAMQREGLLTIDKPTVWIQLRKENADVYFGQREFDPRRLGWYSRREHRC